MYYRIVIYINWDLITIPERLKVPKELTKSLFIILLWEKVDKMTLLTENSLTVKDSSDNNVIVRVFEEYDERVELTAYMKPLSAKIEYELLHYINHPEYISDVSWRKAMHRLIGTQSS